MRMARIIVDSLYYVYGADNYYGLGAAEKICSYHMIAMNLNYPIDPNVSVGTERSTTAAVLTR